MIERKHFIVVFLLNIFTRISLSQSPPVVPLTNALTAIYCHHSDEPGVMTIRCRPNEKIRMLDAFDAAVREKSRLPAQCLKERQNDYSIINAIETNSNQTDCKVHTSFTSACSGRENCTLHMQRIRLNSLRDNCQNDLVDYTMAFFECISDAFIHDVCSSQVITSAWGTLQTPNFPNPYTSSDDCWCKLSTQYQHRLLLSIIVFQLIPYDQHCVGAGLYLQNSDGQRSTQCTYLQQGHNYLSDNNTLYINFYSRIPTVRGGFWIIYEATHPMAEVHLHCGPRDKIGVPAWSTSSPNSVSPPPISTPFDHGWSRLAFDNLSRRTTPPVDPSMKMSSMTTTTPYSKVNTSTPIGAFTYPHGSLTTFELVYGPRGWYLKHPAYISDTKLIENVRTTSEASVVKWNYTWRYTRPFRNRFLTNRTQTTKLTTKPTTTTTTTTTRKSTTTTTIVTTTTVPITTVPTTTKVSTTLSSTTTTLTDPITTKTLTTTIITTTTTITTTTKRIIRTATPIRRLLFTHTPWVFISSGSSSARSLPHRTTSPTTTIPPIVNSTPVTTTPAKSTVPFPTPWYSPVGQFDWWQWQWYTTRSRKPAMPLISTSTTAPSTTITTTTTTTTSTITTTRTARTFTTTPSTTTTTTTTTRRTTTRTQIVTSVRPEVTNEDLSSLRKETIDDFDEEYRDWLEYLTTNEIQGFLTSTVPNPTVASPSPRQQAPSFLNPLTSKSPIFSDPRLVTVATPPAKRHHAQQYPGVSERNAIAVPIGDQHGNLNYHNMIRRVIEQRGKKTTTDYGWLSKTDMTIVAVSVLFVILLAAINLILFAVRRHRHRLQGRHLLSTSVTSGSDERRLGGNRLSNRGPSAGGDSGHVLMNGNNGTNNNDILPAVGEIVIWDEKDQGGYMIDNNGAWAKIEGRQWFGTNIFKNCSKTSLSKSFRSRFRLIRHTEKKTTTAQPAPMTPKAQQTFKFPLMMETATLSPVPEADDYESSDLSLSDVASRTARQQPLVKSERNQNLAIQQQQKATKLVQALVHQEQRVNFSDDYYKRIEHPGDDSNYTLMPLASGAELETDRSVGMEIEGGEQVLVSVPTMFKQDDDAATITDGIESIYNPHYSIQTLVEPSKYLQPATTTTTTTQNFIVGHCQTDFQPLDPKLLMKTNEKLSRSTQSVHLSTYDSGFIDEQAVESSMATSHPNSNDVHLSLDDILLTKSEDEDDEGPIANRQKWKNGTKRVSFQEEHVVQRFSPTNLENSNHLFETYDTTADLLPIGEQTNNNSATTSSVFTVQKPTSVSIEREESTETIIMDHLHSVKSLKKFFETKMIFQRVNPSLPPGSTTGVTTQIDESSDDKQDQVFERSQNKTNSSEISNPSGACSTMTTSSIDYNLAVQRHYSRRFRSSSTSNNSQGISTNIVTHIQQPSQSGKRALSHDRQQYQTTDHFLHQIDKWKNDHQRSTFESDDDDNVSESSMLWQAKTKLNQFVARARKSHQQPSFYTSFIEGGGTPTEDLYTFDDNESVTAETRF